MVQWLKALNALPVYLFWFPISTLRGSQQPVTPVSVDLSISPDLCRYLHIHDIHRDKQALLSQKIT